MRVNLDVIMSIPDAVLWFSKLRDEPTSRATIVGWIRRYELQRYPGGYRYGDLLQADARARRATREVRGQVLPAA